MPYKHPLSIILLSFRTFKDTNIQPRQYFLSIRPRYYIPLFLFMKMFFLISLTIKKDHIYESSTSDIIQKYLTILFTYLYKNNI